MLNKYTRVNSITKEAHREESKKSLFFTKIYINCHIGYILSSKYHNPHTMISLVLEWRVSSLYFIGDLRSSRNS